MSVGPDCMCAAAEFSQAQMWVGPHCANVDVEVCADTHPEIGKNLVGQDFVMDEGVGQRSNDEPIYRVFGEELHHLEHPIGTVCDVIGLDATQGNNSEMPRVIVNLEGRAMTKGRNQKRGRGRPRKVYDSKALVSDLLPNSMLLTKKPDEIENTVWQMGQNLGVSSVVDEVLMINKLAEMERRDRVAIGRFVDV
ncbi:hypothetical protein SESBI_06575 [Sesbania bispinosa]|nr:hypothetical protein SESBI_06575 [Sesbania bispinosa]